MGQVTGLLMALVITYFLQFVTPVGSTEPVILLGLFHMFTES